jgi:S-DNA-T family DNA segregation ATPase FtsK/SpoIIIE
MPNAVSLLRIASRAAGALVARRLVVLPHAYQRELCFVVAVGLTAFYVTALASFSPQDPSGIAASFPPMPPTNLAGALGAALAGYALFGLGLVAWLVPLPLVASAWLVLRGRADAVARSRLFGWALALACLACVVAARRPLVTMAGFELQSGGVVGTWLHETLVAALGGIGSLIVIATAGLCAMLLVLRVSLLEPLTRGAGPRLAKLRGAASLPRPSWLKRREEKAAAETPPFDEPRWPKVEASEPAVLPPVLAPPVAPRAAQPTPAAQPSEGDLLFADEEDEVDDNILVKSPPQRTAGERPLPTPYVPPPLSIFKTSDPTKSGAMTPAELESTAQLLVKTFEDFGVFGKIVGYQPGPVVTVFEYQPDAGVKQSKVLGLIDDLALALKVDSIFIHPVRGKRALGVQVPNPKRDPVYFGDIVSTPTFREAESPLTFNMGKTISGQPMCADLAAMPHLLVAGATGSGKSVAINALLCSTIMKAPPDDVRMILVDPKMLELSVYEGIPHLLMPVITEPVKASLALKWATEEMERRYRLMQHACVRHISGFNQLWARASESKREELRDVAGDANIGTLPYLLLVIDELADLMMTAPKDVESSIQRLAQKARASGIHMVLATQRPSVDIITGVIKANLPCRIAFQVVSKHDSRTILDLIGAEKLLGRGDMLLQRPGVGRLERIQGALITDEEVLALVAAVKATSRPRYDDSIMAWIDDEVARQKDKGKEGGGEQIAMDDDPKWDEAVNIARTHGVVSASFLQRHLKIGYNRAARIVEFMESKELVDKADGAKPRKWRGPMS